MPKSIFLSAIGCLMLLLSEVQCDAQGTTYYGYKSRSSSVSSSQVTCDDLVDFLKSKGRYLHSSFGGYSSNAIDKIQWYEYEDVLYCLVQFKWGNDFGKRASKPYIYGGWEYSFSTYYDFKQSFEDSDSKGAFFWKYIEAAKIDCD